MPEFFLLTNSKAAPFVSDTNTGYCDGPDAETALAVAVQSYRHPCGLYAANLYASADAYHKHEKPLAQWACQKARMQRDGVPCGTCGKAAKLSVANKGDGDVDGYRCMDNHETLVPHGQYEGGS